MVSLDHDGARLPFPGIQRSPRQADYRVVEEGLLMVRMVICRLTGGILPIFHSSGGFVILRLVAASSPG
ncbi:MAG: hypothetical protein V3S09_06780 [Candidatus Bathyarchaeia archaeon]